MNKYREFLKTIKILTIPLFATIMITSCAPTTQFVLMPNPDGKVGSLEVSDNMGSEAQKLDQAWQSTQTSIVTGTPGSPVTMDEKQVKKTFQHALKAQPLQPLTYIMYFENDKANPTADSLNIIPKVLETIKIRGSKNVIVIGYTDSVSSDEYNLNLSLRRAKTVAAILVDKGVDSKSIKLIYYGKRNMPIPTPDSVSEPQNRRVEITIQ